MKNRASVLLKKVFTVLSSMSKAKTVSLKSKTRSIKARLVIFSLLTNKKFLMTSLSQKFQSLLGQNPYPKEETLVEGEALPDPEEQSKAIVFHENANAYESLPNPTLTESVENENEREADPGNDYNGDDDNKYPDLTHSLFDDSEDLNFEGSVIDMVKNSKQEAGQEFNLEDDIDHVADLFIRKFHKQMMLQKLHSIKEHRETGQKSDKITNI